MADSHHNFGPERASSPPSSPPYPTPDFLLADAPMFARVFRNSPVGMVIAGPDDRYLAVNDAFARMIGWSVAALLGRSPVELGLMSAGDANALAQTRQHAPAGRLPAPAADDRADSAQRYRLAMIGGDGRPRIIEISVDWPLLTIRYGELCSR